MAKTQKPKKHTAPKAKTRPAEVLAQYVQDKLPTSVRSASQEVQDSVQRVKADRQVERENAAKLSRLWKGKVFGHDLGPVLSLVGTAATAKWRDVLATLAGIRLVP